MRSTSPPGLPHRRLWFALLVLLLLGASACGGGDDDTAEANPTTTAAPDDTTEPVEAGPVEVEILTPTLSLTGTTEAGTSVPLTVTVGFRSDDPSASIFPESLPDYPWALGTVTETEIDDLDGLTDGSFEPTSWLTFEPTSELLAEVQPGCNLQLSGSAPDEIDRWRFGSVWHDIADALYSGNATSMLFPVLPHGASIWWITGNRPDDDLTKLHINNYEGWYAAIDSFAPVSLAEIIAGADEPLTVTGYLPLPAQPAGLVADCPPPPGGVDHTGTYPDNTGTHVTFAPDTSIQIQVEITPPDAG